MASITLIVGGSVSGKSAHAEQLAKEMEKSDGGKVAYLATGVVIDEEFAVRVERHRKRRPKHWQTIEEPLYLRRAIRNLSAEVGILLIDGVGTWITNFIMENGFRQDLAEYFDRELQKLKESLDGFEGHVVLVGDEVGMGIIPESREARMFRDLNGLANQELAKKAESVEQVVCGFPRKIK